MSIKILQIEDAQFGRWAWWSNWIDFAAIDHEGEPYLVQMSMSRRNKKRFRCVKASGNRWNFRMASWEELMRYHSSEKYHTKES